VPPVVLDLGVRRGLELPVGPVAWVDADDSGTLKDGIPDASTCFSAVATAAAVISSYLSTIMRTTRRWRFGKKQISSSITASLAASKQSPDKLSKNSTRYNFRYSTFGTIASYSTSPSDV